MKILLFLHYVMTYLSLVLAKKDTEHSKIIINNITAVETNAEFDSNNLTNGMSCLSSFLSYSLDNAKPISLLISDNDYSSAEYDIVLKSLLESDLSVYLLTGVLDLKYKYSSSPYAIILIDKPGTLEYDKTPELLYLCSDDCLLYIVILTDPYFDEQSFLADATYLVQILFYRKIHNAVIAGSIDKDFVLAKSIDFRSNEPCNPTEPIIIGNLCEEEGSYDEIVNIMFRETELNNCIMKVSYFNNEPYVFLSDGVVSGIEVLILNEISFALNFQLHYVEMYFENVTASNDVILSCLKKDSQFVIGGLNKESAEYVVYTIFYDVSNNLKFYFTINSLYCLIF